METVQCKNVKCGKDFLVSRYKLNKGFGKYCCRACYWESKRGKSLTESHKKKIGIATKKMWKDGVFDAPHIRKAYSNQGKSTKGSRRTIEQRISISKRMKGKPQPQLHTPEAVEKRKQSQIGKKQTEESNEKRSKALKGRVFTEEHRKNLSIANRNRPLEIYKRGKDHPNWIDGQSKKDRIYKYEFRRIKKEVKKRDNYKCRICFEELIGRKGVVHHIDADKKNNDVGNLILICTSCHGKIHAKKSTKDMVIMAFRSMLYQENKI